MATLTVIYDPQDRVAFRPPVGSDKKFDDIKFASLRVDNMDKIDMAFAAEDLTKVILAQLQKA